MSIPVLTKPIIVSTFYKDASRIAILSNTIIPPISSFSDGVTYNGDPISALQKQKLWVEDHIAGAISSLMIIPGSPTPTVLNVALFLKMYGVITILSYRLQYSISRYNIINSITRAVGGNSTGTSVALIVDKQDPNFVFTNRATYMQVYLSSCGI